MFIDSGGKPPLFIFYFKNCNEVYNDNNKNNNITGSSAINLLKNSSSIYNWESVNNKWYKYITSMEVLVHGYISGIFAGIFYD